MPTRKEKEYYSLGFGDGIRFEREGKGTQTGRPLHYTMTDKEIFGLRPGSARTGTKPRKLSAWNKFVKANSKKPRFVLRSGKLNLKKMGVAFRKTPAGKKKR